MAKVLRLLLAVLLGFVVGSLVNGGLILISGKVIPPPAGADVTTTEGLKASLHLFEAKHFIFPFLAHALGTLSGAFVAGLLAPNRSALPAYGVGGLFLLGGVASVLMLPAPAWFSTLDLVLAYLPAAWLGQAWVVRVHSDENSDL
ncbi:hypothetical protein [Geothrix sp.]|jgi:hypothetical protein|uniref:hypothetical protein n=1 Tax=Geothrix sp. TaxID=1962974 RepID=UPI0025BB2B2E|nr:hypothetical protein [Geothrix sp.]